MARRRRCGWPAASDRDLPSRRSRARATLLNAGPCGRTVRRTARIPGRRRLTSDACAVRQRRTKTSTSAPPSSSPPTECDGNRTPSGAIPEISNVASNEPFEGDRPVFDFLPTASGTIGIPVHRRGRRARHRRPTWYQDRVQRQPRLRPVVSGRQRSRLGMAQRFLVRRARRVARGRFTRPIDVRSEHHRYIRIRTASYQSSVEITTM